MALDILSKEFEEMVARATREARQRDLDAGLTVWNMDPETGELISETKARQDLPKSDAA